MDQVVKKTGKGYRNPMRMHIDKEKHSTLFWITIGFVIIFLFVFPFQKALFNGDQTIFQASIYSYLTLASLLLLFLSIYIFSNWSIKNSSDWISIFIWLLPFAYLISMIHPASSQLSKTLFYLHISYAVFFLTGLFIVRKQLGLKILEFSIVLSGHMIVLFGFLNWFGNSHYQDAIMSDYFGQRLTSVFQYANSYAAYLIAILIVTLYFSVSSRKWYSAVGNALMLVPIIISIFLTLSRGGLVVLPFILLLVLPFLALRAQILLSLQLAISMIASLLILGTITRIGQDVQANYTFSVSIKGWGYLLLVSILAAVLCFLFKKFLERYIDRHLEKVAKLRLSNMFLPVAILILALITFYLLTNTQMSNLLPSYIKQRIENINFQQSTLLERGTFYKDAMKIVKDYPVIGAGGGAWAALYEAYQTNPYVSRQAHNFLIQYLVEIGIVGILLIVLLLGFVFYRFISGYIKDSTNKKENGLVLYIISISLLIHSIIDFDMSYAYLSALVFLCLGGMVTSKDTNNKLPSQSSWKISGSKVYPAFLIIMSVYLFIVSVQYTNANASYNQAVNEAKTSGNLDGIMQPLNHALTLQPNNPSFMLLKISILTQVFEQTKDDKYYNEALQLINQLKLKEPNNRQLLDQELNIYLMKNAYGEALKIAQVELKKYPWEISIYEKSISLYFQLGMQARDQMNTQSMEQNWKLAFDVHQSILQRQDQLKLLNENQMQGRSFGVTPNIALTLGQIQFFRGDFPATVNMLREPAMGDLNQPITRDLARWYLAALQKQNKNDQDLYNKLVTKDPAEKDKITGLMNMK